MTDLASWMAGTDLRPGQLAFEVDIDFLSKVC